MSAVPTGTTVILRHDTGYPFPVPADREHRKVLDTATWDGLSWQLSRLDIALGTCQTGPSHPSFVEAARAWRAGIIWGD